MRPLDVLKWSLSIDLLQEQFRREDEIFPERFETQSAANIGEYVKKELHVQASRVQTIGKVTLRTLVLCPPLVLAVEAGEYLSHHL